jgi:protein-disulfide isomerase
LSITRRDTLVLLSAASTLALSGPAWAAEGDMHDVNVLAGLPEGITDHVLGDANAPVTVIEYASPTCPHCAAFSNDVYPAFKTTYIDTGKVKFIIRPFLRNVLDAVIFMLAEAAGPESYHNVVETFFRTQAQWSDPAKTPREEILVVAKQLGFTEESFDAALTNQALFDAMETMRTDALEKYKLEGTPTFYINGKQLTGDKTLEQLAAEIEPLLPADMQGGVTPAADGAAPATGETASPVEPMAETPAQ